MNWLIPTPHPLPDAKPKPKSAPPKTRTPRKPSSLRCTECNSPITVTKYTKMTENHFCGQKCREAWHYRNRKRPKLGIPNPLLAIVKCRWCEKVYKQKTFNHWCCSALCRAHYSRHQRKINELT